MRTDGFGLHWLVLLFPLARTEDVVFEPRKGVGRERRPPMWFGFHCPIGRSIGFTFDSEHRII